MSDETATTAPPHGRGDAPVAGQGPAAPAHRAEPARGGLPPILYPLLAIVFGGILVWSFSRILLSVNKRDAAAIALLTALNILVGAALVAYGPRVRRRSAAFPLLVGAGIVMIAAGSLAFTFGDRAPEKTTEAGKARPQTLSLTAQSLKFVQSSLSVHPGKVSLTFTNKDSGVQHNFVLFRGTSASGPVLFRGSPVTGPNSTTYGFTAPGPGTYFFHCEFHPTTMTGKLNVTAGGAGPPSASTLDVTAKNLAFNPTSLSAPGGGTVTIKFTNDDPQVPHNIVVFNGTSATGTPLFTGTPVTGPGTATYSFAASPPGTYFFHCEFHPTTMKGTLKIGGP
jgi:plastocyanin